MRERHTRRGADHPVHRHLKDHAGPCRDAACRGGACHHRVADAPRAGAHGARARWSITNARRRCVKLLARDGELAHIARLAKKRNCGRFEWSVLDWNEPAIRTYDKLNAKPMKEWILYRLTGEALDQLAQEG